MTILIVIIVLAILGMLFGKDFIGDIIQEGCGCIFFLIGLLLVIFIIALFSIF